MREQTKSGSALGLNRQGLIKKLKKLRKFAQEFREGHLNFYTAFPNGEL